MNAGPGWSRLLAGYLALAGWVILPGNLYAAHVPQSAFIQVGAILLLTLWLAASAWRRRLAVPATPFDLPLLALLGWMALSLLWSRNRYEGVQVWMHWAACTAFFVVAAGTLRRVDEVRRLLLALFCSGLLTALLGILQHLFQLDWLPQSAPPAATFMNRNLAAVYVVMTLPVGPALLLHRPRSKHIVLVVAACAVMGSFLLLTLSRSAWAAFGVQAALCAFLLARDQEVRARWSAPRGAFGLALAGAGLIVVTVLASAPGPSTLRRAYDRVAEVWLPDAEAAGRPGVGGMPTSVAHRRVIWLNTAAMVRDAPLGGVGLGNHKVEYPPYARAVAVDTVFGPRRQLDFAHNDYLQALAELGVVGFALLAWLALAVVRSVRVIWRSEEAPVRALVLGVGLGLAGLMVDAAFSFPFQQAVPVLVFAAYLAVLAVLRARSAGEGGSWRLQSARAAPAWIAAGMAAAALAGVGLLHARWLLSDREALLMLRAERRNAWTAALARAEKAHRLNPHRRDALLTLGAAHLAAGRPAQAVNPLERLLLAYPHDLNALGNLGLAQAALGQSEQAMQSFERVRSLAPEDPVARHQLGTLLETQGRLAAALEEYRVAAHYQPRNASYQYRWGVAALRAGRAGEARQALRHALAIEPNHAATHKALGVTLFEALGEKAEGAHHLRRALELDPQDRDAGHIRAMLEREGAGVQAAPRG